MVSLLLYLGALAFRKLFFMLNLACCSAIPLLLALPTPDMEDTSFPSSLHPSILSRLLTDLCTPLASFQRGTVSQPPPATPAKALLMSTQAEGQLHITLSPVSQFVQCAACLFHDISASCLACDPLVLTDLFFFLVFLLQSCCSSLHAPAADCSHMASQPCTCVRAILQFVQFLQSKSYPPQCLQSLPSRPVWRFKKQNLLITQVINESNEQRQARPDSGELGTKELSLSFCFDSKLSENTEPCFRSV